MAAPCLALCALALTATLPVAVALRLPKWSWLKPPAPPTPPHAGSPAGWKQAQMDISAPRLQVRGKSVLCHTGSVWVVLDGDLNLRTMTFGDSPDSPVQQTMVHCRGPAPESCFPSKKGDGASDSCNLDPTWCPCDFYMPHLPALDMEYEFIAERLKNSDWDAKTDPVEKADATFDRVEAETDATDGKVEWDRIEAQGAETNSTDVALARGSLEAQAKGLDSNPNHNRVLMIGLGGGMLPQYLLEHIDNLSVDAVELDNDVVSTARAFFGVAGAEASGRLRVVVSDGLTALHESRGGYGAVIVDCAVDGLIPEACRSKQFTDALFKVVREGGEVMQNVFTGNPRDGGAKDKQVKGDLKDVLLNYGKTFSSGKGRVTLEAHNEHSLNAVVLARRA